MAAGTRWTRDQLLIVLNLYHKLRFGQFHKSQPVIIDLAERLGRTPTFPQRSQISRRYRKHFDKNA